MIFGKSSKRRLRFVSYLLVFALACPTTLMNLSAVFAEDAPVYGDVNGDKIIDAKDALEVLQHAAKIITLSEDKAVLADVNLDGVADAQDALDILKKAAKIIDKFEAEKVEPTEVPATDTPVPATDTPAPATDTPAPATDTPAPATDTPAPATDTPAPATDTPAPATETPVPTEQPVVEIPVEMKKLNHSAVLDEESGVYTFLDPVEEEDGYSFGVEFINPFDSNTNIQMTMEEALAGQALFPYDAVGADAYAVQTWRGNYTDTYYGDPYKYGNEMTDEEKNPETATQVTKFQRPVWTKGATVSFWFKPTTLTAYGVDPIFTMMKVKRFVFALQADGSISYQDMSSLSWEGFNVAGTSHRQKPKNGFTAVGDAKYVNPGEWNYYTITIANDWIQVYINGEEVIYNEVGMTRKYNSQFNGGYMTRYNPIGRVLEDPDPVRQYITKCGDITTLQTPENFAELGECTDKDNTCIRSNGIYQNKDGYLVRTYDETNDEYHHSLVMDNLTEENAKFFIGGYPTLIKKSLNWANNGTSHTFYTDHVLAKGNQFAGVSFFEKELTAEEVKTLYEGKTKPADVPVPTDTPTSEQPSVTLAPELVGTEAELVATNDVATVEDGTITFLNPEGHANGVEIKNPFAGAESVNGASVSFWFTPTVDVTGADYTYNTLLMFTNKDKSELIKFDYHGTRQYKNAKSGSLNVWGAVMPMKKDEKQFVTYTIGKNGLQVYLNGVSIGQTGSSGSASMEEMCNWLSDAGTKLYIGGTDYTWDAMVKLTSHKVLEGTVVSAVKTYTKELSADDVKAIYDYAVNPPKEEEPAIPSMDLEVITTNDAVTVENGVYTFLDPTDKPNAVEVKNPFAGLDNTNGASVSFWFTPTEDITGADYSYKSIVMFSNPANQQLLKLDYHGTRQFKNNKNKLSMNYWGAICPMKKGEEQFITLVMGSNGLDVYLNGRSIGYTGLSGSGAAAAMPDLYNMLTNAETKMYIGGSDQIWEGDTANANLCKNKVPAGTIMRDIKAYNTALTEEEINTIYNSAK